MRIRYFWPRYVILFFCRLLLMQPKIRLRVFLVAFSMLILRPFLKLPTFGITGSPRAF